MFFPHREYDLYTQKEMPELHYNNTIRGINSAKYLCHLCCRSYYDYETFKGHIKSEYHYSKYYNLNKENTESCSLCYTKFISNSHFSTVTHNKKIDVIFRYMNEYLCEDLIIELLSFLPELYVNDNKKHKLIAENYYG